MPGLDTKTSQHHSRAALDWLIVGGGVQGTHLAHFLADALGVARDRLRVLDPHPQPLAQWDRLTANVGMAYLRSTGVHHLALDPDDLRRFGSRMRGLPVPPFVHPYARPAHALFQAHCRHVCATHRLDELFVQGTANGLARRAGGWRVETKQGSLEARQVLLAIGRTWLNWPAWAAAVQASGGSIRHIFQQDFLAAGLPALARFVVVGGGITAAQVALQLARRAPGSVTLLMRHPVREHDFDADAGWFGPKFLEGFQATACYGQRRQMIGAARYRGSIPPAIARAVREAAGRGLLALRQGEVASASVGAQGAAKLRLADGGQIEADQIVLATGFDPTRPGHEWLDHAIAAQNLPCAACGYPIVDQTLRWAPGLYVSGALAELEIGPIAANIAGARHAARRLQQVVSNA